MPFLQHLLSLLPSIGVFVAVAVAIYALFRSKTADVLRGERDAWQEKCERVSDELKICSEQSHKKDIVITELQAKTDLTEITKAQLAILANQTQGKDIVREIQSTLAQIVTTMQAMERRLDKGLVLGK